MASEDSNKRTGVYFDKSKGRYRVKFMLTSNGTRIRRSRLLPRDIVLDEAYEIAESMRAAAIREIAGLQPSLYWTQALAKAKASKKSWFWEMYWRAKQRAAKKGKPFTITPDDLESLLYRAAGRCEVTGISFSDRAIGRGRMRPLVPSLDRVKPALGYTKDNCRIVCAAINIAMFNWGEEMFKNLALGYLIHQVIAPHASIFHAHSATELATNLEDRLLRSVSH